MTRAEDEPITLEKKGCRPVCRRQSVMVELGDPLFAHLVDKFRASKKLRNTALKVNRLGLSWSDKREHILADCQAEIRKHEFQADCDRRSIQKLNETIESQEEEICRAHRGDERRRQKHQPLHDEFLAQNWDIRKAHEKSLSEMEELKELARLVQSLVEEN